MPKKGKAKVMKMRGVGGDVGVDIGDKIEKEIVKLYNQTKDSLGMARGGMARGHGGIMGSGQHRMPNGQMMADGQMYARGGMMARGGMPMMVGKAGVGQQIEDYVSNWWNGLFKARGGSISAFK
jgi:hypothetical protein